MFKISEQQLNAIFAFVSKLPMPYKETIQTIKTLEAISGQKLEEEKSQNGK